MAKERRGERIRTQFSLDPGVLKAMRDVCDNAKPYPIPYSWWLESAIRLKLERDGETVR